MAFLRTLALGAGAMYFLDPEKGTERREAVRDGWNGFVSDINKSLETGMDDLRHRVDDVKSSIQGEGMDGAAHAAENLGLGGEWAPAVKLVAAAGGTAMIFYGALRGRISPVLLGTVGVAMATRGGLQLGCASEASQSSSQQRVQNSASGGGSKSNSGMRSGKQELSGMSAGI